MEEKPYDELSAEVAIRKEGESGFCVGIPENLYPQRRTAVIARGLGHLFLHVGYQTDWEIWDRQESMQYARFKRSEEVYQANEFAVVLLMPRRFYREVLQEHLEGNRVRIVEVADWFHVSVTLATNRGLFLG